MQPVALLEDQPSVADPPATIDVGVTSMLAVTAGGVGLAFTMIVASSLPTVTVRPTAAAGLAKPSRAAAVRLRMMA